jgi:hypothetical protein
MGWKISAIIIKNPIEIEPIQLVTNLGFQTIKETESQLFETAMYPDDNHIYIGKYNGNLILCEGELTFDFFDKKNSKIENRLFEIFPNSEICSVVLHSYNNLWGYSISENGIKKRIRFGASEDGTIEDLGNPLEEELDLLSKSSLNEDGERIYTFEDSEDKYTEDQVGENFVFAICKRYFDKDLDEVDDLLFETEMTGFTFGKSTLKSKPWWKFW